MGRNRGAAIFLSLAVTAALANGQATSAGAAHAETTPVRAPQRLLALLRADATSGALVELRGGPPWRTAVVAPTAGGEHLRRFGDDAYVVNRAAGTLEHVPLEGGPIHLVDIGSGSEPQDVSLRPGDPGVVIVTRRSDSRLLLVDVASGRTLNSTDLAPVGGGAPIALGTMAADSGRLFVQVKVFGLVPGRGDTGVLAVVDLASLALVDVDPLEPGTQGIALQGAPPQFKMQVLERSLFVSATEGLHDGRGAIERVDLDTLTSLGAVLSEQQIGDLGGFAMTSLEEGYFVFHTDLAASTHLNTFSVQAGPTIGPEIVLLLGDTVDVLVHDPAHARLYLPTRFADGPTGVHAVDTRTATALPGPIPTGMRVHDVVLR